MAKERTKEKMLKDKLNALRKNALEIVKTVTKFEHGRINARTAREDLLINSVFIKGDVQDLIDQQLM